MSVSYNPKIVTDGLVLALDAGNSKSYPGLLGPELVTDPVVSQIDNNVFNLYRTAETSTSINLCSVESGKTYYLDYLITSYTGTVTAAFRISNSTTNLSPTINIASDGRFRRKFTAVVSGTLAILGSNAGTNLDIDYVSVREVLNGGGDDIFDLSSANNNATLTNGPIFDPNQNSIIFDGTNDSANVTFSTNIFAGNYTIEVFFYVSEQNRTQTIIGQDNSASSINALFIHYASFNELTLRVTDANGTGFGNFRGELISNQWYHCAMTVNFSSSEMYTYLNAVPSSAISLIGFTGTTSSLFYIGSRPSGSYLNGGIANVKVYNRALTANEILQNFNAIRGRYGI